MNKRQEIKSFNRLGCVNESAFLKQFKYHNYEQAGEAGKRAGVSQIRNIISASKRNFKE